MSCSLKPLPHETDVRIFGFTSGFNGKNQIPREVFLTSEPNSHTDGAGPFAEDPNQLAETYLDMWQDHLRGLASDPNAAATVGRFLTLLAGSSAAMSALAQTALTQAAIGTEPMVGLKKTVQKNKGEASDDQTDDDVGTASVDASSDDRDADMAQLVRRIDELEQRLAQLENHHSGTQDQT